MAAGTITSTSKLLKKPVPPRRLRGGLSLSPAPAGEGRYFNSLLGRPVEEPGARAPVRPYVRSRIISPSRPNAFSSVSVEGPNENRT